MVMLWVRVEGFPGRYVVCVCDVSYICSLLQLYRTFFPYDFPVSIFLMQGCVCVFCIKVNKSASKSVKSGIPTTLETGTGDITGPGSDHLTGVYIIVCYPSHDHIIPMKYGSDFTV